MTISGDKGREKEEGAEKSRQKGKEVVEPYDTVVVGPDGVGYVWTFRGTCQIAVAVVQILFRYVAVSAGQKGSQLMLI